MDPKGKGKPSLAVILAAAKPKPGGGEDDAMGADSGGGYTPSPECVKSVQHFFEAGADGDYEGAARALSVALEHIESGEGESEPEGDDKGY